MSEHTPTPWVQHDTEYCPEEIWGDLAGPLEDGQVHGTHVCTVEDGLAAKGNAEFIVRACNCHDELLAACKTYKALSYAALGHLDEDRDAKCLKLLRAMAGHSPGYRADIDSAIAAMARSERISP